MTNPVVLYTAQHRYFGANGLDITVKGQDGMGIHFAPTWNMVTDHKKGIITDQEYVAKYLPILQAIPEHVWTWFFSVPERTLICFCKKGAFCHRNILVNWLILTYGARIINGGFHK
jgi:hypothetical protein